MLQLVTFHIPPCDVRHLHLDLGFHDMGSFKNYVTQRHWTVKCLGNLSMPVPPLPYVAHCHTFLYTPCLTALRTF